MKWSRIAILSAGFFLLGAVQVPSSAGSLSLPGNLESNVKVSITTPGPPVIDRIVRSKAPGGLEAWAATTSLATARDGHCAAFYNGYLYVVGGQGASGLLADVQIAQPNGQTIASWTQGTALPSATKGHACATYNGYLYVLGGQGTSGPVNQVLFAQIQSDGSLGAWSATKAFANARTGLKAVAYDGYLYVLGGRNGATYYNDVQLAAINGNGALAAWSSTTAFTTARADHAAVAYGGYVYLIAGDGGSPTPLSDIQRAAVGASGTLGAWSSTTTGLGGPRMGHAAFAVQGHLYVVGGNDGTTDLSDVQVFRINLNSGLGSPWASRSFSSPRKALAAVAGGGSVFLIGGSSGATFYGDVQTAPLDVGGAVKSWASTTVLATARYGHQTVAYNGYLYVIGGFSVGGPLNDVQVAPINSDGTVGAWTPTSTFTNSRGGHASVAYNGHLYVLGGYDGVGTKFSDVQVATINANGTLGAFSATASFTTARSGHAALVYDDFLYVLGGLGTTNLSDVQVAPLNSDGTVGAWSATSSFPTARHDFAAAVYAGYLYVIGGDSGVSTPSPLADVQMAAVGSGGGLGSWSQVSTLQTAKYAAKAVAHHGFLYVTGGNSGGTYLNGWVRAPINPSGSLGNWSGGTFPTARAWHGLAEHNHSLYVVGGNNGTPLADVQLGPTTASGMVGPWSTTTPFSGTRYDFAGVSYNGFLYVIGGCGNATFGCASYLSDVQYARVSPDGTVGSWTTSPNALPNGRMAPTAEVYGGRLLVIGGYNGTYFNDVQSAPINADGSIGAFTTASTFTTGRYHQGSAITNGHLYVFGGFGSASILNDVQVATLGSTGSVGTFSPTTSMNPARAGPIGFGYNGNFYLVAGCTGKPCSGYLNDVVFTPINADGTLGSTWTSTSAFPAATRTKHMAVLGHGYLYLFGGTSTANYNDVLVAPFHSDGTLGAWTWSIPFTTPRYGHIALQSGGFAYVLGGYDGTTLYNDVQTTVLGHAAAVGEFSRLFDLSVGGNQLQTIQVDGTPGLTGPITGIWQVANATGTWGPQNQLGVIPLGTPVTAAANDVRYLWIHLGFDDSLSAAINGQKDRDLTGLTLNYLQSSLAFTTSARTFTAGSCPGSSPITVQLKDASGAPLPAGPTGQVLVASSTSTGAVSWFQDAACGIPAPGGRFTIPAGSSSINLYYQDTRAGSWQVSIGASPGVVLPSPQAATVIPGPPSQLVLTTAAQTFAAGACPGATLGIQVQDAFGNPTNVTGAGVSLTASSTSTGTVTWTSDSSCATVVPGGEFNIPSGASSFSVFYQDSLAGSPIIRFLNGASLTNPAPLMETVTAAPPSGLVFTTASQSLPAGACSSGVGLQSIDPYGNPSPLAQPTTVSLSSSSAGATFFADANCSTPVTSIGWPGGAGTAQFFFTDQAAGTPTVVVSAMGLSSASQTETIAASNRPVRQYRISCGCTAASPRSLLAFAPYLLAVLSWRRRGRGSRPGTEPAVPGFPPSRRPAGNFRGSRSSSAPPPARIR